MLLWQIGRSLGISISSLFVGSPRGKNKWEATEGSLTCALDFVEYVRANHCDYVSIAVAGFPDGHPSTYSMAFLAALTVPAKRRARVVEKEAGVVVVTVSGGQFPKKKNDVSERGCKPVCHHPDVSRCGGVSGFLCYRPTSSHVARIPHR